ncbi:MAG: hypothetical protein HDR02_05140 [Lachnospiraceae bacterium]|nr:hypothetical protein [Lachnospiraceae bacterium]
MSVSLLVFKGEDFNNSKSQVIAEMPVSFQNVWNETWEKAISECKIKIFVCGGMFSINAIPSVLTELDSIFDWVNNNGGRDMKYIQNRIQELKEFLNGFYNEQENLDYWFDLG